MRVSVLLAVLFAVSMIGGEAHAQKRRAPAQKSLCGPGFHLRMIPGDPTGNFGCRTNVIGCPERRGKIAVMVADGVIDTQSGLQFGYRCEYRNY